MIGARSAGLAEAIAAVAALPGGAYRFQHREAICIGRATKLVKQQPERPRERGLLGLAICWAAVATADTAIPPEGLGPADVSGQVP
jgi:hypothetical protein